jgi:hypothetical protein
MRYEDLFHEATIRAPLVLPTAVASLVQLVLSDYWGAGEIKKEGRTQLAQTVLDMPLINAKQEIVNEASRNLSALIYFMEEHYAEWIFFQHYHSELYRRFVEIFSDRTGLR